MRTRAPSRNAVCIPIGSVHFPRFPPSRPGGRIVTSDRVVVATNFGNQSGDAIDESRGGSAPSARGTNSAATPETQPQPLHFPPFCRASHSGFPRLLSATSRPGGLWIPGSAALTHDRWLIRRGQRPGRHPSCSGRNPAPTMATIALRRSACSDLAEDVDRPHFLQTTQSNEATNTCSLSRCMRNQVRCGICNLTPRCVAVAMLSGESRGSTTRQYDAEMANSRIHERQEHPVSERAWLLTRRRRFLCNPSGGCLSGVRFQRSDRIRDIGRDSPARKGHL